MTHPPRRLLASGLPFTVLVTLLVAGCGGGDDSQTLPRLAPAKGASLVGTCDALAGKLSGLAHTTVTASESVAAGTLSIAGQPVPAHCRVTGAMYERTSPVDGNRYAIGFEMRLPLGWNGRFYYQGNGGTDGAVAVATGSISGAASPTGALLQGFAVISSDAGHGNQTTAFGMDPQARLDYGYQAAQKLTPMAKSLIQTAYGKGPDRSYFGGCSNGGRHTMVAMSRLAEQYDGFLAGNPAYNLPQAAIANIFGAQRYAMVATSPDISTGFTTAERNALATQVLAKCDALDGARDGLVQDVDACRTAFNFATDMPTCVGGVRDGNCLTTSQKNAIAPIFSGATDSRGNKFYAAFPFDPGVASSGFGSGTDFWEFFISLNGDPGSVAQVFAVPPVPFVGFNGPSYALNLNIDEALGLVNATNATYTESAMSFMNPPQATQLNTLRSRGAKVMMFHGVADAIFSVEDSTQWYRELTKNHGGDATDFARYYRVPGMGHCYAGPSTDQFDMLTPLVAWVEQGTPPESVVATARGAGNAAGANPAVPAEWGPARTRPLCAYPKVARYSGTGDINLAANFSCQ